VKIACGDALKAGWTNELPYPIDPEISSQKGLSGAEKGFGSKDLRRSDTLIKPFYAR